MRDKFSRIKCIGENNSCCCDSIFLGIVICSFAMIIVGTGDYAKEKNYRVDKLDRFHD
jgi:hypothetical protein